MQPTPSAPLLPAEGSVQSLIYGSCEATQEIEEPLDWEANGELSNLMYEIACGLLGHVILLVTLVASLEAGKDSFLKCNQEDTPQLRNYGEVLLCHYTQAFIFSFPAMATAVLLLLFGRDFLQKYFYYGLLRAGGVISFNGNKPWRDVFFIAVCLDFFHCVGYTCFHLMILHRSGIEAAAMSGFVPSTTPLHGVGGSSAASTSTAVTTLTTTLAVKGALLLLHRGGPKGGGGMNRAPANVTDSGRVFQKYLATFMVLVATFLEAWLLVIFMYYAYDITNSLVPMSEYLESYEGLDENPMERLHSFKDSVAKSILEHSPQLISTQDGDLHRVYVRIVEKYAQNKDLIRHPSQFSPDESLVAEPSPEEPPEDNEPEKMSVAYFPSIGLFRSLWPAELLLRRDIAGNEAKNVRRVWLVYSALSIFWLVQISVVLVVEGCRKTILLMDNEIEQVIPLTILVCHVACVVTTMYVFCESLAPFAFTQPLMGKT